MKFFFRQPKVGKRILLLALGIILVCLGSLLQQRVLKIKADVQVLLVSDTDLPFGTVFPGQTLVKAYAVQLDTSAVSSGYVTQLSQVAGLGNLCPYLQIISIDTPSEPDTLSLGNLTNPGDIVDNWQVKLNAPGMAGQVAQDHNGGIVVTSGDFGCKITVTTDLGEVGGCEGSDCTPPGGGGGSISVSGFVSPIGGNNGNMGSGPNGNPTPGLVAGDFTNDPSSGGGSNPPGEVLGATELPRTGMPVYVLILALLISAFAALVYKKRQTR